MTVTPDDDFAAAEYALGTLDPSERAVMAARRLREPDLDEAIRAWEARLAPLAEAAGPIEPPRDLLPAIEARIRSATPEAPGNAAVASLRRSVMRWRAAAIAASIIAGVLAVGFIAREATREAVPHEYVAILQKDAASPAFAITVNVDTREFTVRPVAATADGALITGAPVSANTDRAAANAEPARSASPMALNTNRCGGRGVAGL